MRVLYFLSLSLVVAMTMTMSCTNEDSGEPDCDGSLSLSIDSTDPSTSCSPGNGSITVNAAGGKAPYRYSLDGGTKQSSGTFSALSGGVYTITVFDANNCEDEMANIEIDDTSTLDVSATPSPDTDCSSNNGSIVAVGSGGVVTTPYQFALDNGAFGASGTFNNLAPGNYSVKIKDAGGCIVSKSVTVLRGSTGVSYQTQIKPILEANCIKSGCHNGDNGAARNWSVFANVQTKAQGIKTRTGNKSMPADIAPTGLPQDQIDLIACWVDDGAPNN